MEGCKRPKKAATEEDHGESTSVTVSRRSNVQSQASMWALADPQ